VSSDYTFNCCKNSASANFHNNNAKSSVPPTVTLQSLPVRQVVFCSNSNESVIISAKHISQYLTTEQIRYVVSNQGSPVTACRDNFTFCTTQQFHCTNSCWAVCHNICYSYSQSVATFCTTLQFNCTNCYCVVCHNICYSYSQSVDIVRASRRERCRS
jgi:hypothetical protein